MKGVGTVDRSKVTMKINRDVYRKLQEYKLKTDSKSLSDAIDLLLENK